MQDGVEIMNALTELQEELEEVEEAVRTQDVMYKVSFTCLNIDSLTHNMQLAVKDGSGFTEDEILDHVNLEQHAGFLKSHMSQNKDTLGGKILTWLTEEYLVSCTFFIRFCVKLIKCKGQKQVTRADSISFPRAYSHPATRTDANTTTRAKLSDCYSTW
jgi:hypothetical protein